MDILSCGGDGQVTASSGSLKTSLAGAPPTQPWCLHLSSRSPSHPRAAAMKVPGLKRVSIKVNVNRRELR